MPDELALVDTNVLIYAMDADAQQNVASRALVEAARDGTLSLCVTPQILCEFYSIVTNARRVLKPRSPADALSALAAFRAIFLILTIPAAATDELLDLLRRRSVTGADVFDLQLIAAMKSNGVRRIYTFNAEDFAPFPEIVVLTP